MSITYEFTEEPETEERDGIVYLKGTDTPLTGKLASKSIFSDGTEAYWLSNYKNGLRHGDQFQAVLDKGKAPFHEWKSTYKNGERIK